MIKLYQSCEFILCFPLQDVCCHLLHDSLFGSVADDQKLMM